MPPEDTAVALAGDRVVVAAGGDVWSTPVDAFTEFDGDADPVLTFGAGAVTSVDPAGVLFAYTPSYRPGRPRRRGRRGDRRGEVAAAAGRG